MKTLFWLSVAYLGLTSVLATDTCEMVTDDVESACEFPSNLLLISFPSKYEVELKNCGAEYNKSEWQEQPTVIYQNAKPDKSYLLINVDPDPPAYEKNQYFLHWLVSNIKGEDFLKGDLSKANHLKEYYGPAPPAGSGVHRYMFMVFEEKELNLKVENPTGRAKFELVPWLQREDKLCGPVAGNQFRTQY